MVLEGRAIGAGQTGRTTAHLMIWNDDYYSQQEELWGTEKAMLVADSHKRSVDWVEGVVKEEGIDCEFVRWVLNDGNLTSGRFVLRMVLACGSYMLQAYTIERGRPFGKKRGADQLFFWTCNAWYIAVCIGVLPLVLCSNALDYGQAMHASNMIKWA